MELCLFSEKDSTSLGMAGTQEGHQLMEVEQSSTPAATAGALDDPHIELQQPTPSPGTAGAQVQVQRSHGTENIILTPRAICPIPLV